MSHALERGVQWFTDFADQSIIVPIILLAAVGLLVAYSRRAAIAWLACTGGVLLLLLLLKLGLGACGPRLGLERLATPSGHTASGTVVYGGLVAAFRPSMRAAAFLPVLLLVALAFGASRLVLHVHTVPEVVVGGAVGMAGALLFFRLKGSPRHRRGGRIVLAILCALPVLVLHGERLPAEQHIHGFAATWLRGHLCPSHPGRSRPSGPT